MHHNSHHLMAAPASQAMVDNEAYRAPLVVLTAVLGLASLSAIGALYHFFAPTASCSINILFITLTLILGLAVTALSVSRLRTQDAGLLTAVLIVAYCVFLVASALMSLPPDSCTPTPVDGDVTWILVRPWAPLAHCPALRQCLHHSRTVLRCGSADDRQLPAQLGVPRQAVVSLHGPAALSANSSNKLGQASAGCPPRRPRHRRAARPMACSATGVMRQH